MANLPLGPEDGSVLFWMKDGDGKRIAPVYYGDDEDRALLEAEQEGATMISMNGVWWYWFVDRWVAMTS